MQAKERRLRSVLGWAANDGETIIPAGLPDRLVSHENWDETLGVVLSHSHTIQEQAAVVRQCELQLLSRKLEESGLIEDGDRTRRAELRNEQLRVARERARLEDLKLDSANRLTQALQQCDVARSELQTYRNRHTAADKCLRALGELADLGKRSNVTELLDAQRRWVASREDYCTAIAGLFAATRVVHVQKGTLLGYHRIMIPTVH